MDPCTAAARKDPARHGILRRCLTLSVTNDKDCREESARVPAIARDLRDSREIRVVEGRCDVRHSCCNQSLHRRLLNLTEDKR
jgi:hypothetical protein